MTNKTCAEFLKPWRDDFNSISSDEDPSIGSIEPQDGRDVGSHEPTMVGDNREKKRNTRAVCEKCASVQRVYDAEV